MIFIGPSFKVPPKRKGKEWEDLRNKIDQFRKQTDLDLKIKSTNTKHEIEKEIEKLKQKPDNKDRMHLVQILERRLRELSQK